MELVRPLEQVPERSLLATARFHRKLTVEEVARRSGLRPDEVEWLEEGRAYRFPSTDDALLAAVLYATALGIDRREARELAGRPLPPRPLDWNPLGRLVALGAIALLLLVVAVTLVQRRSEVTRPAVRTETAAGLPPAWRITVDVLNGSGDINHTRRVADRIGALAYRVNRVARADRFDYRETAVFYERGGQGVAGRLARELGVGTKPLPGGDNPRRLVVVVGPPRGPG